jgi:hypothetical protein
MTRPIALLTDFGLEDTYVAQMKAVLAGIAPDASILDISHAVRPHDVAHGAFLLETTLPFLAAGTVVVAVVDPGVGGERAAVVLVTPRAILVGPDNGVLWPQALAANAEGGEAEFFELTNPAFWRDRVSNTFHGRDIFAPVGARLALAGDDGLRPLLMKMGRPFSGARRLELDRAAECEGKLHGHVLHQDRFGNLVTNIHGEQIPDPGNAAVLVEDGTRILELGAPARTYSQYDHLVALVGSAGYLELAIPSGSAARLFGARAKTLQITVRTTRRSNPE